MALNEKKKFHYLKRFPVEGNPQSLREYFVVLAEKEGDIYPILRDEQGRNRVFTLEEGKAFLSAWKVDGDAEGEARKARAAEEQARARENRRTPAELERKKAEIDAELDYIRKTEAKESKK